MRKVHECKRCPGLGRGWLPVPQHDDQSEFERCFSVRQKDREANLDTHFPVPPENNKIVKERIWINPVTSKIMKQPLESDTDAELHEERVISVRKQAESASRVLHDKRPR